MNDQLTRNTKHATRNALFLSNFNSHTSGRAGNYFTGRIQIVRIEIDHFQIGNLFELRPGDRADPIPFGVSGALATFAAFFSNTAAGGVFVMNVNDRS
jgi:hypothetical protein